MLAVFTAPAGCRREAGAGSQTILAGTASARPARSATPSPAPTPLQVVEATQLPADTLTPAEATGAPDGPVRVAAFLRLRKPTCRPCPQGAECEPCPLPFHQLSDVSAQVQGLAGRVVYADFEDQQPPISLDEPHVFEGELAEVPYTQRGQKGSARVLVVTKIHRLRNAAEVAARLSSANLERWCQSDADCEIVDHWPRGWKSCCGKCPSDAVARSAAKQIAAWCARMSAPTMPRARAAQPLV